MTEPRTTKAAARDADSGLATRAPTPAMNTVPPPPTSGVAAQSVNNAAAPGAAAASTAGTGAAFGRYHLERLLGEGAMGTVWLAVDTTLARRVALKIPKFAADDAEARSRFLREARLAASLHHANICPIFDVGEHDGRQYLTMAFIEGRTLEEFVSPGKPLPPRQAAQIVRKLALALAEAHAAGVVHRDLKPANVMIDKKGEPIVMDFGLARSSAISGSGRLTQSGVIVGSPAYMAPEQAEGDPSKVGPRCDIYSLGVVLFELLTGRVPFEGNVMAVLTALATKDVPSPREFRHDLDEPLAAVCRRMTARRPEDRYATMNEAADALKACLTGLVRSTSPKAGSSPASLELSLDADLDARPDAPTGRRAGRSTPETIAPPSARRTAKGPSQPTPTPPSSSDVHRPVGRIGPLL